MLYELLTGKVPILGDSNIGTLMAIRQQEPKRPSTVNRSIPSDLEAICLKCLHKDPEKRYRTAWQLGEDLQRWLNGEVVMARRPGTLERLGKWVARNKALTTTLATITAGLIFSGLQWRNAQTQADRAQRNVSFAQETISDLLQRTAGDSSIPAELRTELAHRAISLQTRLLEEEPDNNEVIFQTAWAYMQLANISYDSREYQAGLDALDVAADLLAGIDDSWDGYSLVTPAIHAAKFVRANILNAQGRHDEAIELFAEDLQGTNPFQLSGALQTMGHSKWNSGDLDGALIDLKNAVVLRELAGGNPVMLSGDVAVSLLYQGRVERQLGQIAEADSTLEKALTHQTNVIAAASFHESMEETMARIQHQLGHIRCAREQYGSSRTLLEEAEARFKMLTQWNRSKPRFRSQWFEASAEIVYLNIRSGSADEANDQLTELESRFEEFDSDAVDYLETMSTLAENHIEIGKHRKLASDQNRADVHFDRAEHWIDEMESHSPNHEAVAEFRIMLNEAR